MILFRTIKFTQIQLASYRYYTTNASDLRILLQSHVKIAMKNRDIATSTTLRSVISEINSAAKASKDVITNSAMVNVVRKAVQRRLEAVETFNKGSRPDLAEKERHEAELLSKFLPPLLSSAEIDMRLKTILSKLPNGIDLQKSSSIVFKDFYSQVDKSNVDADLVKNRLRELTVSNASSQLK